MTDKELIAANVDELTLMEYYYGEKIVMNINKYRNHLRNDKKGTCAFRMLRGKLRLVDYAKNEKFDVYSYVMEKYKLSFSEAIEKIMTDFRIKPEYKSAEKLAKLNEIKARKEVLIEEEKLKKSFRYVTRSYGAYDKHFWTRFCITLNTLKRYNVEPVESLEIYIFKKRKYFRIYKYENLYESIMYRIKFEENVKFYRPLARKENDENKWISNTDNEDCYGFAQLDLNREGPVIIASGLKDVLCLSEMGYNVIAPMSEVVNLPQRVLEALKSSCKEVYYLFDTDVEGMKCGVKFAVLNSFKAIWLPKINGWKDVGEFVENIGLEETKNIINLLIDINTLK